MPNPENPIPISKNSPLNFSNPLPIPIKALPPPIEIINAGNQQQLVAARNAIELPIIEFL